MSDLRLLVVASDPLARAGLVVLLGDREGFHVAGQVDVGESLPDEIDVYQPDVIVWDLGWEPDESLGLLEELSAAGLPVVVLASDDETAAAAASAGAKGVLYRDAPAGRLLAAVTAVVHGLAVFEEELLPDLIAAGELGEPSLLEDLTPRELEVLGLVAEGLSNRAIALALGISEHTVKFHLNAIMRKTDTQSRTAAVVQATRLGLIAL